MLSSVAFYSINVKGEIEPLKFTQKQIQQEEFRIWQNAFDSIDSSLHSANWFDDSAISSPQKIVVLFIGMEHFSASCFYNHLIDSKIRRVFPNAMWARSYQPDRFTSADFYHPVITIGAEDIMSLYAEGSYEEKKENELYKHFRLDSRFKFFDSSIWHRYVSLCHGTEAFASRFLTVFEEMYDDQLAGIYATISARSHLEFQLRLMQNSYIAEFGRGGHDKSVTPFKFHSETMMRQRWRQLESFFEREVAGMTLKESLRWKILMVDDYAEKALSTVPGEVCQLTKRQLVKQRFLSAFQVRVDTVSNGGESEEATNDDRCVAMVARAVEQLNKEPYDLIFLDYLLGHKNRTSEEREYGHDLMQRLMHEGHAFQKGPFHHFWIFPFSSFPFALGDKLRQLGVGNLDHLWHLGSGGDPVSMPHLFRYFLLSFLQQQLFQVYLSPDRLVQVLQYNNHITDSAQWAEVMVQHFTNQRTQLTRLEQDDNLDEEGVLYAVRELANNGYLKFLNVMISLLEEIATGVTNYGSFQLMQKKKAAWIYCLEELFGQVPEVPKIIKIIECKIDALDTMTAIQNAKNRKLHNGTLNLAGLELVFLPPSILKRPDIKVLRLERNRLESLPEEILHCEHLRRLNVGWNRLESLPLGLDQLKKLRILNTQGNPGLPHRRADHRAGVLSLLKDISKKTDIFFKVEELIISGEVNEAIKELRSYSNVKSSKKLMHNINMLHSRWSRIKDAKHWGTASDEAAARYESQVISGLLYFVREIQSPWHDKIEKL